MIEALVDATTPGATVVAYTDWDARYDELLDPKAEKTRDAQRRVTL